MFRFSKRIPKTLLICFVLLFNLLAVVLSAKQAAYAQTAQPELLAVQGTNLVIVNPNGVVQRTIYTQTENFTEVIWSPNGSKIAFTTATKFGVVNADGSGYKQIATLATATYDRYFFAWAPDSTNIIYGLWNPDNGTFPVNQVKADGSGSQKLFDIKSNFFAHLVSYWSDGKKILYQEDLGFGPGADSQVVLCDLDGSNKVKILDTSNFFVSSELSPSGDQFLFHSLKTSWVVPVANPRGGRTIDQGGETVAWSNTAGKIITITAKNNNGGTTSPFSIDELDVATGTRRTIVTTPPLRLFGGEGNSVGGLAVDQSGLAVFVGRDGTYTVDLRNGQINSIGNVGVVGWRPAAQSYGNILPEFYQIWKQSDLAIANGQSNKSWLWGPDAFATKTEDYKEAKDGKRQVQYFDKARMELNNPDGDRSSPFFVTNGLLPKELIGGYIQSGDNQSQPKAPADINVAGDPGGSITYAKLGGVVTLEPGKNNAPNRVGQAVTATIDRNGTVSEKAAIPGVGLSQFIPETGHNIPNVFVDYFKTLPQDWVFVMGFPLSEPYQTEIILGSKPTLAIIQVFERRVLTYTPSNLDPYKVEQGNVGRHYFQWRYGN